MSADRPGAGLSGITGGGPLPCGVGGTLRDAGRRFRLPIPIW